MDMSWLCAHEYQPQYLKMHKYSVHGLYSMGILSILMGDEPFQASNFYTMDVTV